MPDFVMRLNGKYEAIHEIVREKAYRDSMAAGKDVSRHSLMLELLEAGLEAKKDDPGWKKVMDSIRR